MSDDTKPLVAGAFGHEQTDREGPRERRDALVAARDEIGWYFGCASAAIGFGAQGYEEGDGAVWDDARINALHVRMLVGVRSGVERRERIHDTMVQVPTAMIEDLADVYVPFGIRRIGGATSDVTDRANWAVHCLFSHEGRQLIRLALRTPEMLAAYRRKHHDEAPAAHVLLDFVSEQLGALSGKTEEMRPGRALPTNHCLAPALRAAQVREEAAAAAYDDVRAERVRRVGDAKRATEDRVFAEMKARADAAVEAKLRRLAEANGRSG